MILKKSLAPLFALFVSINSFAIIFRGRLEILGFDIDVLLLGNLFLCVVTSVSFSMLWKGMQASSTPGFLSAVYGSFIIKFMVIAAMTLFYAWMYRDSINKPSLFSCMFLYLLYTFLETRALMVVSKKKEDAKG
jgi:uncharacterized membrane protein YvlD (DUF360 family)